MLKSLTTKSWVYFIFTVCTVGNAFAGTTIYTEKEIMQKWKEFKGRYRKLYVSSIDEASRYKVFKSNLIELAQMNDRNEKVNGQRPYGITKFLDMSPGDFAKAYLTYRPNHYSRFIQPARLESLSKVKPPAGINWTKKGATGPILNQGSCGSCWAYSAVAQLETAIFMKTGVLPSLSVQQVVSCSTENSGCQGGDTIPAYAYMIEAGVQSEESYPYSSSSGDTGSCEYDKKAATTRVASWKYVVPGCDSDPTCESQLKLESTLKQQVAKNGPASVCLHATAWQYYKGGVLAADCPSDKDSMDHCVQLVGYDTASDGSQYWILRNQWGQDWGEDGFIRLKMGSNVCGVVNEATNVTPES